MILRRFLDVFLATFGLIIASPLVIIVIFLVWLEDRHSPFYVALRVGRDGRLFKMVKIRSMVVSADLKGGSSTSNLDMRITPIGHFIRRYKIDELMQLWNVVLGDMSLVGPRPQVQAGVDVYSNEERKMLTVKPGITDIASIVFSDEGDILARQADPDISYNQLIRPGKSKLSLFYISKRSFFLDLYLIYLTVLAVISKPQALKLLSSKMRNLNASKDLVAIASRAGELTPSAPPGAKNIVTSRDGTIQ